MKYFSLFAVLFACVSCTTLFAPRVSVPTVDVNPHSGQTSMVQTGTSATATTINVLRPRLQKYKYEVRSDSDDATTGAKPQMKQLETTASKDHYWSFDRLHITGLDPDEDYTLHVTDKFGTEVDWRKFRSLDIDGRKEARFAMLSCASDDFRYQHIADAMWDRLHELKPDFIVMTGDIVYVDSKNLLSRKNILSTDIWQRYIEALRSLRVFNRRELTPVLATWDDHDYGVNNSDKTFKPKQTAEKLFRAFFGGVDLPQTFSTSKQGVYKSFHAYGQRFFLLDNRYFREKQYSKLAHAHWGTKQHKWLINELKRDNRPAWIINGGQFFAGPFKINGRQINESLLADHPTHHGNLMKDLKTVEAKFAFGSGDIHFSEILKVDDMFNFKTFEFTASPMHAFIFRPSKSRSEFWENPRRIVAQKDYNFMHIISRTNSDKGLDIDAASYGIKQTEPFFRENLSVR